VKKKEQRFNDKTKHKASSRQKKQRLFITQIFSGPPSPLSRTPKALKKRVTGGKKRNPLFCPFGKENEKKQDRN
jgi:hypothetical protein